MNREIPIKLGAKSIKEVNKLESVTFSVVFLSIIIFIICVFLCGAFVSNVDIQSALYWMIFLFASNQFFYLVQTSCKSRGRFRSVSLGQLVYAFALPLIAIPLTYFYKLEGFIVGNSVALIIGCIMCYRGENLVYRLSFDWTLIKYLVKVGIPIMAVGITYTFLNTTDRWIITYYYDIDSLGYYSMAIMVFGVLTLLPRIVAQQIYPRMAYDWGEHRSKKSLLSWLKRQTKYVSIIVIPLFCGVELMAPVIIDFFLPQYSPGISAIRIIAFGVLTIPFSAGWGSILNITNNQIYYLYNIIGAIILNVVLNIIFVKLDMGIEGIALGTAISFGIYNTAIMLTGRVRLRKFLIKSN